MTDSEDDFETGFGNDAEFDEFEADNLADGADGVCSYLRPFLPYKMKNLLGSHPSTRASGGLSLTGRSVCLAWDVFRHWGGLRLR
jgi:hypothetical protein